MSTLASVFIFQLSGKTGIHPITGFGLEIATFDEFCQDRTVAGMLATRGESQAL
jgi:hypothetical protein